MQNPHTRNIYPAELERLRSRIDEIDAGLIDLIATRLAVAREASALKEAAGLPREDLAREAAEVRRASALARRRGVEPEVAREVFWRLIGLSRWATAQRGEGPGIPVPEGAGDPR